MGIGAKKILSSLILVSLAFLGCGKKNDVRLDGADDGGRIVVASFYPMYVAALKITDGASGIRVVNMAPASSGCLHDRIITPNDAKLIEKASAMIINGGGMEPFADKLALMNKNLAVIDASAGIDLIYDDGDGHERRDGRRHGVNTHVWMSVENHARQIKNIAKLLSSWDTANAQLYNDNTKNYVNELTELTMSIHRQLTNITSHKIVISHDGFLYFAREFGLTVTATIEKSHEKEPSAADLAAIIDVIKKENPRAIFVDKARPSLAANTVSAETGLPIFELDMVTIGDKNLRKQPLSDGGQETLDKDMYIAVMKQNAETLKKALE
jgi:zinc transport system substrate-binding protein